MKSNVLSRLVPAAAVVAIPSGLLSSFVSVSAFNLFVAFSGFAAAGIVGVAFADYTRKPRFRVRAAKQSVAENAVTAKATSAESLPSWTYQTISA
jgi:hypothetical protein